MLVAAGRTDPGRVRRVNQDAFIVDPRLDVQIVADGMGGHQGGAVAATIAAQTVYDFVRASREDATITWPSGFDVARSFEANQLRNAVCLAHRRIVAESRRDNALHDMGSTVVAFMVRNGRLTATNVGDSRLYLLRAGTLNLSRASGRLSGGTVSGSASPA